MGAKGSEGHTASTIYAEDV